MAILAKQIIAMKAFIEDLQSLVITLKNGGLIQSENFQQGQSGFRIRHNGEAEFNAITIREGAYFEGEIQSGPLRLLNTVPAGQNFWFGVGTTAHAIYDAGVRNASVQGTFAGQSINRIEINERQDYSVNMETRIYTETRIWYASGTASLIAQSLTRYIYRLIMQGSWDNPVYSFTLDRIVTTHPVTLSGVLSFAYLLSGKTFRLLDLPTHPPQISGTVWRDGNTLKIS